MGHIHAAAMAEYAKDASETDKPWERWEFSCGGPNFKSLITHPQWNEDFKYRAIKTILNNGRELSDDQLNHSTRVTSYM